MPALALYLIFLAYPILYSLQLSLYDWDPFAGQSFIGFRNYEILFSGDPIFNQSFVNTLIYVVETAGGQTLLGLVAAAWVANSIRMRTPYRVVYFLPVVIPLVMSGWLWAWGICPPGTGLINWILRGFGLKQIAFTGLSETALATVAAANNWHWAGFTMAVYIAAYEAIPQDLFEAAALDGAGPLRKFWHVTIPHLRTATIINVLLTTAGSFQAFDLPFAMTMGGPSFTSYTLGLYIYEAAFTYYRIGYAATLSVILFIIIAIVSVFYLKIGRITELE